MASDSLSSQIALGLVLSLTSVGVGYKFATLTSSSSKTPSSSTKDSVDAINTNTPPSQPTPEPTITTEFIPEEEKDEEDAEIAEVGQGWPDGDLGAVSAGWTEQCKMVLVVRTDLKMTPGTIATQCADATLKCYKVLMRKNPKLVKHWEYTGQAKIALKGKNEEQLLELQRRAKQLNLCARIAVSREVAGNVRTVLAIGPAPVGLVNEVTGKLRLL